MTLLVRQVVELAAAGEGCRAQQPDDQLQRGQLVRVRNGAAAQLVPRRLRVRFAGGNRGRPDDRTNLRHRLGDLVAAQRALRPFAQPPHRLRAEGARLRRASDAVSRPVMFVGQRILRSGPVVARAMRVTKTPWLPDRGDRGSNDRQVVERRAA
jgi:hypothetical protein